MKRKIVFLVALAGLAGAAHPLRGAPLNDGVAAIVDNEVVTYSEVQQEFGKTDPVLWRNSQSEALFAGLPLLRPQPLWDQVKKAKQNCLEALIDRLVIIHYFQRDMAGFIPDKYVEERINDIVTDKFHGDRNLFEKSLADRDVTFDEYQQEIIDNAIVGYMNARNVTEKVKALKPANPDEEKKLIDSIRKAWIDSLREKSYIKNFLADDAANKTAPAAATDSRQSFQKMYLESELARLTQHLQLTPEQATETKATMEDVVSGRPIQKTVDQELHEILRPEQLAEWEEMKKASVLGAAIAVVTRKTDDWAKQYQLSAAQRDQLYAALYQIELTSLHSFHSKAEMQAYLDKYHASQQAALMDVLNPGQMAAYWKQQVSKSDVTNASLDLARPNFPH